MPKATTTSRSTARRHNPLADDIISNGHVRTASNKSGKKRSHKNAGDGSDDEDGQNRGRGKGEAFIDAKTSRKILQIGQDLADEDAAEQQRILDEASAGQRDNKAFDFSTRFGDDDNDYISEDEDNVEEGDWEDEDLDKGVCFNFF